MMDYISLYFCKGGLMDTIRFPDPRSFGFDQISFEPLGNVCILRFIRRKDGTNRQVLRIILPFPYLKGEIAVGETMVEMGYDVRPFDRDKIVGWGLRAYIDNSAAFRSVPSPRQSGTRLNGPLIDTNKLKPATWPYGPALIRGRPNKRK